MIELKTKKEIAKIEKAGKLTAEIRDILAESAKPGVTTKDLDNIAVREMKKRKVESVFLNYRPKFSKKMFPANICASVNEEIVHGIPRADKVLKEGDIISIDIATRHEGFVGDTAVTVGVGKISAELKWFLKICEQSLLEGVIKSVIGNHVGDIGFAINKYLTDHSLFVVKNYFGHGIGREMHEEPMIPHYGKQKDGLKLEEGFVFTIEPMICMESEDTIQLGDGWTVVSADGKPAGHFEHTIAITKDEPEILTKL